MNQYFLKVSLLVGLGFFYYGKKSPKNISFIEQLILIICAYILTSVLIAIPFYLSSEMSDVEETYTFDLRNLMDTYAEEEHKKDMLLNEISNFLSEEHQNRCAKYELTKGLLKLLKGEE